MCARRILITDSVTINTGDAAILQGLVTLVRATAPDAEIRIHCHFYDLVRDRYPHLPLARSLSESLRLFPPRYFWRWPASRRYQIAAGVGSGLDPLLRPWLTTPSERAGVADYVWADVVLSCGGSFLTDSYLFDHVLAGYRLGRALGKRMIVLGQTLGPFNDPVNLRRVGEELSHFDLVAVRDARSGVVGCEMGIPAEKLAIAADMAFNLSAPPLEAVRSGASGAPRVGVSVRRWVYPGTADSNTAHGRYVAAMAAALDLLVERSGADIVFVSTCQGEPNYPYKDDQVAAQVRAQMRFGSRAQIDASFNTPDTFMRKASEVDVLIGTRMHSCILAMLAGTPSVNIEYEFKSRELFDHIGLSDLVFCIGDIDVALLADRVQWLLANRETMQTRIAAGVTRLREENHALIAPLREAIG